MAPNGAEVNMGPWLGDASAASVRSDRAPVPPTGAGGDRAWRRRPRRCGVGAIPCCAQQPGRKSLIQCVHLILRKPSAGISAGWLCAGPCPRIKNRSLQDIVQVTSSRILRGRSGEGLGGDDRARPRYDLYMATGACPAGRTGEVASQVDGDRRVIPSGTLCRATAAEWRPRW